MRDTVCDGCRGKECCNKIESYWKDSQTGELKVVTDCAPRRTMLMLQDMSAQMLSQQAAIEQLRNENHELNHKIENVKSRFIESSDSINLLITEVKSLTHTGM